MYLLQSSASSPPPPPPNFTGQIYYSQQSKNKLFLLNFCFTSATTAVVTEGIMCLPYGDLPHPCHLYPLYPFHFCIHTHIVHTTTHIVHTTTHIVHTTTHIVHTTTHTHTHIVHTTTHTHTHTLYILLLFMLHHNSL